MRCQHGTIPLKQESSQMLYCKGLNGRQLRRPARTAGKPGADTTYNRAGTADDNDGNRLKVALQPRVLNSRGKSRIPPERR